MYTPIKEGVCAPVNFHVIRCHAQMSNYHTKHFQPHLVQTKGTNKSSPFRFLIFSPRKIKTNEGGRSNQISLRHVSCLRLTPSEARFQIC